MLKCTVHLIGSNLLAACLNPHVQIPSSLPGGGSVSVECTHSSYSLLYLPWRSPTVATVALETANGFVQRWKCSQYSQAFDRRMTRVPIHTDSLSVRGCDCPAQSCEAFGEALPPTAWDGLLSWAGSFLVPVCLSLLPPAAPTLHLLHLHSVCLAAHVAPTRGPMTHSLPKFHTRHYEASKSGLFKKHQLDYNKNKRVYISESLVLWNAGSRNKCWCPESSSFS